MLIASLLTSLSSIAITLRQDKTILYNRSTMSLLLMLLIMNITCYNVNVTSSGIGLYGGLLHINSIGQIFQNIIYIISIMIIFFTGFFPRQNNLVPWGNITSKLKRIIDQYIIEIKAEQYKIIEYPLILLFIITGASLLISSSDIVSIFLCIELQSYGLYLLATLYRNSEISTSAGLTYFLLGGMSSCFILLGTALLYTNSGGTNLESYYIINNIWEISHYNLLSIYQNSYINYSLIIMAVGFLFKISAAPFHFWSPDVYDAIPTVVTAFVAIIAKISILIFLFDIVHYTSNYGFNNDFDWRYILLFSSLLSLIIGTVLGLNQFRIKRLYAYSTISHLGFILLSLSINTVESIQGFIFYLMQYSISNLNAFIILISVGYTLYGYLNDKKQKQEQEQKQQEQKENQNEKELLLDINNSPIQLINQLKGYFYINPLLALSLAITIYSFVGVPPLLGFFGKQMVLSAALDNGFIFISLVAILTSVISAVYYLNIIKNIYFDSSELYLIQTLKNDKAAYYLASPFSLSITLITLFILTFLLLQQDILNISNILSVYVFNL